MNWPQHSPKYHLPPLWLAALGLGPARSVVATATPRQVSPVAMALGTPQHGCSWLAEAPRRSGRRGVGIGSASAGWWPKAGFDCTNGAAGSGVPEVEGTGSGLGGVGGTGPPIRSRGWQQQKRWGGRFRNWPEGGTLPLARWVGQGRAFLCAGARFEAGSPRRCPQVLVEQPRSLRESASLAMGQGQRVRAVAGRRVAVSVSLSRRVGVVRLDGGQVPSTMFDGPFGSMKELFWLHAAWVCLSQSSPIPLHPHSWKSLLASLFCLPLLWCCFDCPSAFLHHVGEAVHVHAFTQHMSADDWKASTSSLGCSTRRQTPKSNCQLTPHVCNPRSYLPPLPSDCHPWVPYLGQTYPFSYQNHILWHHLFCISINDQAFILLIAGKPISTSPSPFSLYYSFHQSLG